MQRLKYLIITTLLKLVSLMPLRLAQRLGAALGSLAWRLNTNSRKVTETNLSICLPELSAEQRERLSRDSMRHTGMTALEIPLMWEWPIERCLALVTDIEGEELLEKALVQNKGLVLLAPHLGNWELVGLYFSSRCEMAALYSPPKMAEFEEYMIKVRGRLGSELVRGDRRGLSRLVAILRGRGVVGILPDQTPRSKTNAFAPFFGMEVKTMTLASKLIQKTGATALVTYAERLPDGAGFRVVIREPEAGLDDADPVVAATALNHSVEACARARPEQYQWEYKRFRHRPAGEQDPYRPGRICD